MLSKSSAWESKMSVRRQQAELIALANIWFVSYAGKYYVISERKAKAHWVQNIMHNSKVTFTVSSKSFEGAARVVDKQSESKLAEDVSSLMHAKYGWSDGLIIELTP
jgi:hypothetical protein